MSSGSGEFVQPSATTFSAAAQRTDWKSAPGFGVSMLNQPGQAWPISSATFILVYKKQANAATGEGVLKFFDWAYKSGDAAANQLDYVPLPGSVKSLVRQGWASEVKTAAGKPVYVSR
jgi:phosphate transport system substrate-binding protein